MNIKELLKNNMKLYIGMGIIILLGSIGLTLAITTNYNPIAINTTTSTIDANITYDEGTNSSLITTTGGEILPIADTIIDEEGENIDNPRVIKAKFNVSGLSSNPQNTIYDVALYAEDISCVLRTEDVKWRLYKNGALLSSGNLSPKFDTMTNNRLVLTNIQQDLTTTPDKYTFILWISESCPGNLSECDESQDQSKYLNKTIDASLKIELATGSKKNLKRTTSTEESCNYENIQVPACNRLIYNGTEQILINESEYYTIKNNTGINAGTHTAILDLKDEYKWTDGTTENKIVNCPIAKKEVTISTLPQNISYGSSISNNVNQVSSSGLISGHTLSSILLNQSKVDIGTGVITASNALIVDSNSKDVTENYEIKYTHGEVTINCQNIASLPTATNYKYTGESFTGITGGEYIDINGTTTANKIGTYTVVIVPKSNYCWSDGTTVEKTLTWKIEKDIVTVALNNDISITNGTPEIYYTDQTYYLDSRLSQSMTTTSNPIETPKKIGYNFGGYYTEEDGNGTKMIDENGYVTDALLNYTTPQGLTLYAYWQGKTYTITYNANGGTGAPASQIKNQGEEITLSTVVPTKNETRFLGWSTNKKATSPTYLPGDTFTVNANTTLYAIYLTPVDFTMTSSNIEMIGYTTETTDLIIPETFETDDGTWYKVTSINSFPSSNNLTNITIPSSVTTIGELAFNTCRNLTSISVDVNNKKYTSIDGILYNINRDTLIRYPINKTGETFEIPSSVTTIGNYAFYNCTNLTNITIPSSVTTIGNYAFYNCTNLTNITIPSSVTTIGEHAFHSCTNLTNVTIQEGVTTIGNSAFLGCSSLTSITIPSTITKIGSYAFCYCTNLTNVTIQEGVTTIGNSAFSSCSKLTNITIPSSVTTIGEYAFIGCTNLTSISVDANNKNYTSIDGILYNITKNTLIRYPSKKNNETFEIPSSVTTISAGAFDGCTNLTNITIPSSVTTIGNQAFNGCRKLTNITIPGSVTTIGNQAFNGCTNLTNVTIQEGVTTIGGQAFNSCDSLTSITIPSSVTTIQYMALYSITSSTNIYYAGSKEEWNDISIDSSNNDRLKRATFHYNYLAS